MNKKPNFKPAPNSPISLHDLIDQWGKDSRDQRIKWIMIGCHLYHMEDDRQIYEDMKIQIASYDTIEPMASVDYDYDLGIVRYDRVGGWD